MQSALLDVKSSKLADICAGVLAGDCRVIVETNNVVSEIETLIFAQLIQDRLMDIGSEMKKKSPSPAVKQLMAMPATRARAIRGAQAKESFGFELIDESIVGFDNEDMFGVNKIRVSWEPRLIEKDGAYALIPTTPLPITHGRIKGLAALPTGLTCLVGPGFAGKTPLTRAMTNSLVPLDEADRVSYSLRNVTNGLVDAIRHGRAVGIDSLRALMRLSGGPALKGGYSAGAYGTLDSINRLGMQLQIAFVGVINPQSSEYEGRDAVDELAAVCASSTSGAMAVFDRPVKQANGLHLYEVKFGMRGSDVTPRYAPPSRMLDSRVDVRGNKNVNALMHEAWNLNPLHTNAVPAAKGAVITTSLIRLEA